MAGSVEMNADSARLPRVRFWEVTTDTVCTVWEPGIWDWELAKSPVSGSWFPDTARTSSILLWLSARYVRSITPQAWHESFGVNNSIETPIGVVKMGDGLYVKLIDKKRSAEFGMFVRTLQDPDLILIEPSEAKEGQTTERPFSYVFVKTFLRNGETIKNYTSVTVQREGLEISTSSHMVSKARKIKDKLMSFDRVYTKQALLPNSSERRLAEHQENDVPDLLPTQGNSVSDGKVNASVSEKQEEAPESSENSHASVCKNFEILINPTKIICCNSGSE